MISEREKDNGPTVSKMSLIRSFSLCPVSLYPVSTLTEFTVFVIVMTLLVQPIFIAVPLFRTFGFYLIRKNILNSHFEDYKFIQEKD